MKKIIALAMALVMMMAICVPAFAVVTGGQGTNGNKTEINTLKTKADGSDAAWFTVAIPAKQDIYWEATETELTYTVSSQLETGKAVKVTVAGNGVLTNGVDSLAYTITDAEYTTSGALVTDETDTVTIDTSAAAWTTVPVDTYSDTLTFSAEIV